MANGGDNDIHNCHFLTYRDPDWHTRSCLFARICQTRKNGQNHSFCDRELNWNSINYIWFVWGGVFVTTLKLGMSIIAASLTLTIIILPVIIRTTEESLKTVPQSYREGSLALGTTKLQTLYKVILPSAMPGILSGIILSMGRIIGESAAIFLTAGTVAAMPESIFHQHGRLLSIHI